MAVFRRGDVMLQVRCFRQTFVLLVLVLPSAAWSGVDTWSGGIAPSGYAALCNGLSDLEATRVCLESNYTSFYTIPGACAANGVQGIIESGPTEGSPGQYSATVRLNRQQASACVEWITFVYGVNLGYTRTAGSCDPDPMLPDGSCDVPPESCGVTGLSFIKSGNGAAPAGFCDQGCSFAPEPGGAQVQFQEGWVGSYTANGNCGPDDPFPPDTDLNCISTSGGTSYCVDPTAQENCGTVNGEYMCLAGVPDGNCMFTPDGQALCDTGSQTNPPDDTMTDGQGNSVDIYGDGNTGGTAGGSGSSSGTDSTGSGGTGETTGECEGSSCSGSLPGGNEATDDYGTQFGAFYARVGASPIIAAFDNIEGSMPAGVCSSYDSDPLAFFGGQVLTLNVHCQLWPDIDAVIYPVMLAVWALLGGIIILRA